MMCPTTYRDLGRTAFFNGQRDNPYEDSMAGLLWQAGWDAAQAERDEVVAQYREGAHE